MYFACFVVMLQGVTHLDHEKGFRIYVFHNIFSISNPTKPWRQRKKIVTVLAYGSKFINKKFENIHHIFNS